MEFWTPPQEVSPREVPPTFAGCSMFSIAYYFCSPGCGDSTCSLLLLMLHKAQDCFSFPFCIYAAHLIKGQAFHLALWLLWMQLIMDSKLDLWTTLLSHTFHFIVFFFFSLEVMGFDVLWTWSQCFKLTLILGIYNNIRNCPTINQCKYQIDLKPRVLRNWNISCFASLALFILSLM